jgi:hypothetical protein
MSDRPTPRTDAEKRHAFISDHTRGYRPAGLVVRIDLARQIERELAEAREEGEEQARLLGMSGEREAGFLAEIDRLKREIVEVRDENASLHEAAFYRNAIYRHLAARLHEVAVERNDTREQRDRLASALRSLRDCIQETRGRDAREAVEQADDALAALKGGAR